MSELETWLQPAIAIACEAGDAILQLYSGEIAVQRKDDNSPLTQADLAAHSIIEAGLAALTPDLPMLSEESATILYAIRSQWRRYWLVDPLDGTREFIKRNGEFTVNIALIDCGKPVMGVVYAPAKNVLYYAASGSGAFKQEHGQEAVNIHARPLDLAEITIAGSRSHADAALERFLAHVARNHSAPALISLGSSLKICLVAEGSADVYPRLGPTSEWDTAAAQCVLESAGGQLVGTSGVGFQYNNKDSLLNPVFFACGATPHDWSRYL